MIPNHQSKFRHCRQRREFVVPPVCQEWSICSTSVTRHLVTTGGHWRLGGGLSSKEWKDRTNPLIVSFSATTTYTCRAGGAVAGTDTGSGLAESRLLESTGVSGSERPMTLMDSGEVPFVVAVSPRSRKSNASNSYVLCKVDSHDLFSGRFS